MKWKKIQFMMKSICTVTDRQGGSDIIERFPRMRDLQCFSLYSYGVGTINFYFMDRDCINVVDAMQLMAARFQSLELLFPSGLFQL